MPIPNATKENLQKAIDILKAELAVDQSLRNVYKRASLKSHPDKQGGDSEPFQVVQSVCEACQVIATNGNKATKQEKLELAAVLRALPKEVSDLIVNKLIKEQPGLTKQGIENPVVHTVKSQYAYFAAIPTQGRSHGFTVNGQDFKNLKDQFKDWKGDHLKSEILESFRKDIENVTSLPELEAVKKQIKSSAEYKVLATGQGLFTKITGIQTTSQKTLEAMFKEQEVNVSPAAQMKA